MASNGHNKQWMGVACTRTRDAKFRDSHSHITRSTAMTVPGARDDDDVDSCQSHLGFSSYFQNIRFRRHFDILFTRSCRQQKKHERLPFQFLFSSLRPPPPIVVVVDDGAIPSFCFRKTHDISFDFVHKKYTP